MHKLAVYATTEYLMNSLTLQLEERTNEMLLIRDDIHAMMQDGSYYNTSWIAAAPDASHIHRLITSLHPESQDNERQREQLARDVAQLIDHTALKPETTITQIRQLCQEARHYEFATVCVNPSWVPYCANLLSDSPVIVCTVIGFPLGATTTASKVFETAEACRLGAKEVDMVLNIGALKSGQLELVMQDVQAVADAAHEHQAKLKVIIEAVLLSDQEKIQASVLCKMAGADFVKTSTGFSKGGATIPDVALMRHTVGNQMGVKAAGGVRTVEDAIRMIQAGANRIGASAGVRIIEGIKKNKTWNTFNSSLKSSFSLY